MHMSEKQSEARKKWWANVDKATRSQHARHAAIIRHKNMSMEEKAKLFKRIEKD